MKHLFGFVLLMSFWACQPKEQENQLSQNDSSTIKNDSTSGLTVASENNNVQTFDNESTRNQTDVSEYLLFDVPSKDTLPENFFEDANLQEELLSMKFPTHIDTVFIEKLAKLEWLSLSRNDKQSEEFEKIEIKYHQVPEISNFYIFTSPNGAEDPSLVLTIGKWIGSFEYPNYHAFKISIHDTWMQKLNSCVPLNQKSFKLSYVQIMDKMNYDTGERYNDTITTHQIFTQKMIESPQHPIWEQYWWEESSRNKDTPILHHDFYILKANHIHYKKEEYEGDCPDC